jgi:hypothetical protein
MTFRGQGSPQALQDPVDLLACHCAGGSNEEAAIRSALFEHICGGKHDGEQAV